MTHIETFSPHPSLSPISRRRLLAILGAATLAVPLAAVTGQPGPAPAAAAEPRPSYDAIVGLL